MSKVLRLVRSLRSEKGATLPFLAFVMVLLLGMAAFATDLGWWYLNSIRIQRASDGAALAGVIHMPGFFATAETAARDIAFRNGYPDGVDGTVVTPEPVTGEPHRLKVTISDQVESFFLRLFGIDEVTIVKESVAEYVTALPMGSPENEFGGGGAQEYRAAIQAPFTEKEDGDPFATQCELSFGVDSCGPGGTENTEYRPEGYRYGVEVPVGSSITSFQVQIYDAGFYAGSEPGDALCGSAQDGCDSSAPGATMRYTQYDVDDSPLDHFDNPVASCAGNPLEIPPESGPHEESWTTLCSFAVSGLSDVGVYPLQVQTVGSEGNAMNMYGIRACAPNCGSPSGDQPRVFGINDISIWADATGATPEFYFAEVDDVHAGKVLLLSLFDPGDANAGSMTVLGPNGAAWDECHVTVDSWTHGQPHPSFTANPCTIDTTRTTNDCGQVGEEAGCKYNGDWLTIEIALPNTYTCDLSADPSGPDDCWWKIRYNYSGAVFDRTTWAARVVGNPVHLVFDD